MLAIHVCKAVSLPRSFLSLRWSYWNSRCCSSSRRLTLALILPCRGQRASLLQFKTLKTPMLPMSRRLVWAKSGKGNDWRRALMLYQELRPRFISNSGCRVPPPTYKKGFLAQGRRHRNRFFTPVTIMEAWPEVPPKFYHQPLLSLPEWFMRPIHHQKSFFVGFCSNSSLSPCSGRGEPWWRRQCAKLRRPAPLEPLSVHGRCRELGPSYNSRGAKPFSGPYSVASRW
jgi:hypothetical protein